MASLSAAFVRALDPVLVEAGFVRAGQSWSRRVDERTVDAVDLQRMSSGGFITINLGVIDLDAFEAYWGIPLSEPAEPGWATVQERVPELAEGRNHWWELRDPAAPQDAAEKLVRFGLPFLDQMHDRADMRARLLRTKSYARLGLSLAIVERKLGLLAESCATLETYRRLIARQSGLADRPGGRHPALRAAELLQRVVALQQAWGCEPGTP